MGIYICSVSVYLPVLQSPLRDYRTDMGNTHTAPQVEDTILTSASETDSEAMVAFNFGGSTGVLVILVMALVLSFFLYQFCRCCMPGRCSKQQRPTNDNQAVNSAIITLALEIGRQQNLSQQQQHQQVQDHQQQQPTRVTPGHSCSTVNQAIQLQNGGMDTVCGEMAQRIERMEKQLEDMIQERKMDENKLAPIIAQVLEQSVSQAVGETNRTAYHVRKSDRSLNV